MSYNVPTLSNLVLTSTFLALLPVTSHLSTLLTNTDLLGPLTLGILWCSPALPPPAPLLPPTYLPFLSFLGYVGLLLLIFDAGISTPTSLLLDVRNLGAAIVVGLTGILVPIALSIALFHGAFVWPVLTAFAAGAALCSTSLGTTVSLLSGGMKRERVGVVLMSAALLDDVVGLVVAGVIGNLVVPSASSDGGGVGRVGMVEWRTIVRPVMVSVAYALGTPFLAVFVKKGVRSGRLDGLGRLARRTVGRVFRVRKAHVHLFIIVGSLMAFVATSHLAGTSELFGAYLAGAFLGYVFDDDEGGEPQDTDHSTNEVHKTFTSHIVQTLLHPLLSPLFFASIGASIPVNQFFTIYLPEEVGLDGVVQMVKSHRVIWRGVVYSILMIAAKTIVGVWVYAFWKKNPAGGAQELSNSSELGTAYGRKSLKAPLPQQSSSKSNIAGPQEVDGAPVSSTSSSTAEAKPTAPSSRFSIGLLLGLAMVARGEIALIVAQLARPLLVVNVTGGSGEGTESEEPFVIVMWSILVTTFAGALGVGWVIRYTVRLGK